MAEPAAPSPQHRQFVLPPNAHVQPVKQTLVQMDVPPDIVLPQQIPIPTALLWQATVTKKQFIAPPLKEISKVAQKLPTVPTLAPPNAELNVPRANVLVSGDYYGVALSVGQDFASGTQLATTGGVAGGFKGQTADQVTCQQSGAF